MAKKGARKSQKRISITKASSIRRKERTWTFKVSAGPHSGNGSIALGVAIRDVLAIAQNAKETKFVLSNGNVMVDGRVRKSLKHPVGIFDVVQVAGKNYRVVIDSLGKLVFREIGKDESSFKLCKVLGKKAFGKGLFQLRTNDGRVFVEKNNDIRVGGTLKVEVPKQKIKEHFGLEKGNTVLIIGGRRVSTIATIDNILPGTISRSRLVVLSPSEGKQFQTQDRNVFVVGKAKPVIEVRHNA